MKSPVRQLAGPGSPSHTSVAGTLGEPQRDHVDEQLPAAGADLHPGDATRDPHTDASTLPIASVRMSTDSATVAEEEYLQTLFWLQEAKLPMTGANVARAMQLSAPTVH